MKYILALISPLPDDSDLIRDLKDNNREAFKEIRE